MNTTDASSTGFNDSLINPEQHMGASAIVEVSSLSISDCQCVAHPPYTAADSNLPVSNSVFSTTFSAISKPYARTTLIPLPGSPLLTANKETEQDKNHSLRDHSETWRTCPPSRTRRRGLHLIHPPQVRLMVIMIMITRRIMVMLDRTMEHRRNGRRRVA